MVDQAKPKDPQKELEILVGELEERVDRLRALYEQYFLGYEKVEPAIPRKDVDRRFAHLRKQQIRNTALRFKFNVITQKFQTYSMYWQRVCRQIEEGTYKRHVVKANQRFAEPAAKRKADAQVQAEDLEALLAEVDAESATFERTGFGSDTLPPGQPTTEPPGVVRPQQAAVPVAPGSKPRVVLRRRTETEPRPDPELFENPGNLPLIMPKSAGLAPKPAGLAPKPAGLAPNPAPAARPAAPPQNLTPARPPAPAPKPAAPVPAAPNAAPRAPAPSTPNAAPRAPAPSTPNAAPRPPAPSAPSVTTPGSPILPKGPPVVRPVQRIALPSAATGPSPATPATPAATGQNPTPSTPIQPRPIIRRAPPTPNREKKEP